MVTLHPGAPRPPHRSGASGIREQPRDGVRDLTDIAPVDEDAAAHITREGTANIVGQGNVSFVKMRADDVQTCAPGRPPRTRFVNVHVVPVGSTFDIAHWTGGPNPPVRVRVRDGTLTTR